LTVLIGRAKSEKSEKMGARGDKKWCARKTFLGVRAQKVFSPLLPGPISFVQFSFPPSTLALNCSAQEESARTEKCSFQNNFFGFSKRKCCMFTHAIRDFLQKWDTPK